MRESEYKKRITDYLKKNMEKGYAPESLKWALVKQGYSKTMVDAAISDANKEFYRQQSAHKEKPVITHEIVDGNEASVGESKPWWKRLFGI